MTALRCERFHKTLLNEFYQVAFRKKIYTTLEELQADLDAWTHGYNHERTHQGKMCCGRTPMATFDEANKSVVRPAPRSFNGVRDAASEASQIRPSTQGPNTPSRNPGSGGPPSAPTAGIITIRSSARPSPSASATALESPGWPFGTKSCG